MVAALHRRKRYPLALSRAARETGTGAPSGRTVLAFSVDRNGKVVEARIAQSSHVPEFDAAALAMVAQGTRLPKPPPDVPGATLRLAVPIVFHGSTDYHDPDNPPAQR